MYWVNRALDEDKRRVFLNSVIHIKVLQNSGNVMGNIEHLYCACQLLNVVTVKKYVTHKYTTGEKGRFSGCQGRRCA